MQRKIISHESLLKIISLLRFGSSTYIYIIDTIYIYIYIICSFFYIPPEGGPAERLSWFRLLRFARIEHVKVLAGRGPGKLQGRRQGLAAWAI